MHRLVTRCRLLENTCAVTHCARDELGRAEANELNRFEAAQHTRVPTSEGVDSDVPRPALQSPPQCSVQLQRQLQPEKCTANHKSLTFPSQVAVQNDWKRRSMRKCMYGHQDLCKAFQGQPEELSTDGFFYAGPRIQEHTSDPLHCFGKNP